MDDCENWTGGLSAHGYARIYRDGKNRSVARLVCEATHGPPFEGAQASHLCHNRKCVKPAHLVWDTPKQNINRNPESRKAGGFARGGTGKGWYLQSNGRYRVSVRGHYIGVFGTEEEARAAYLAAVAVIR